VKKARKTIAAEQGRRKSKSAVETKRPGRTDRSESSDEAGKDANESDDDSSYKSVLEDSEEESVDESDKKSEDESEEQESDVKTSDEEESDEENELDGDDVLDLVASEHSSHDSDGGSVSDFEQMTGSEIDWHKECYEDPEKAEEWVKYGNSSNNKKPKLIPGNTIFAKALSQMMFDCHDADLFVKNHYGVNYRWEECKVYNNSLTYVGHNHRSYHEYGDGDTGK